MIADSAEVEIYLIDKSNMHLYPEDVQKLLNERLSTIFSVERPYDTHVVDSIKNKFREWDKFKIAGFVGQLREQFNIRQENLLRRNGSVTRS